MSFYCSRRFRGIVKEKYRKEFEGIALRGEWAQSEVELFRDYADEFQTIPRFLCDMPEEWDGCSLPGGEFETKWDPETGFWQWAVTYNAHGMGSGMWNFDDEFIAELCDEVLVDEGWCEPL